ncbi:MAG TPA: type II secretion system protein M [Allosphingosinicella sp.]|nr:type II secretion system protein M [Allosphingosinicella sp.]
MTDGLKAMWAGRTRRERWLIAVMLVLVAGVAGWLMVLRPLGAMLADAKDRHERAVVALAEAQSDRAAIARLEKLPRPPAGTALDALVGRAAADGGLSLARLEAIGEGRAAIVIDAARPAVLFGWIAELETRRGLLVERITATANADRTLSAQIVFRARGSR